MDALHYQPAIQEYVCKIQQAFSAALVLFLFLYMVTIGALDLAHLQSLNRALWFSALQILLSLVWYFLFRNYFNKHKKYVIPAACLNIFQVLILLEVQYFLYDEYLSFTIIICIMLSSSVTIIGHVRKYCAIILLVSFVDIAITIFRNTDLVGSRMMHLYIIDNLFIVIIAVGINVCCCQLRYQAFEKEQQIVYLSERDSLTGLLNRKAFEYAVRTYAVENTLCAMILLDLDNFKPLNDTLGHYEGDNCLREVADELRRMFRQTDYVSRLGGDEFVVFMPNIKDADCVIERTKVMLQKIPRTYSNQKGSVFVTCSIGVAFSQEKDVNLYEQMYKAADAAMYRSKEKGKNCVSYG